MAKQEITLQGLDGQLDELILSTNDETVNGKLEDCARMLFPQEGESTPRLRFKGFEGEWEKKLLSDCLEISDEKNTDNIFGIEDVLSVSDENGVVNQIEHLGRSYAGKSVSGYKILRPGQIVYTKSPLRAKPYGIVKHNTGKAGIVSVLYAVYNPKEGVAPEYIHYYFDPAWRLNAYMRPLVNKGAKNTMNISDETALTGYIMIPKDIEEQKRIASFLQRLDDQMKLHQNQFERLKQLKSACLNSMFPNQSENTPPIRFKGFNEDWEIVKLSKYATRVTRKNTNMESLLPLTISASEGLIEQTAFFNNVVASSNMSNYYLLKKGEFAYNKSYSNGFPYGAVKKLEKYEQGALSPLYIVFSMDEDIDSDYIVYFFETSVWHSEVAKRAAEGARNHGLLNIGADDFLDISISLPKDLKEQQLISLFFRGIDSHISTEQQRLERLKQMKSACLRSMFPQNGGGILPAIRFKGFKDEWILMNFSDMVHRVSAYDSSNILPCVEFEDIVAGEGVLNKDIYRKNVCKHGIRFAKNDVLFGKLRPYLKNILFSDFNGIAVGDFWVLRATDIVDPYFLFILVSSESFMNIANISSGSKMPRADWNLVSKSKFAIPPSLEEQRRIGSFFRNMDKQIALQTQKVEILNQVKKACLNKMIA